MKRAVVRILQTCCFVLLFLVALYFVSDTLKFKYDDGVRPMVNYYALPQDTVDVLLLGSSHIGMNADPSIMWREEGIAAYACWAGMQPTWNTYYYLKECLKTQTPKLIIMDTYLATNDLEYSDYEAMVKTIIGMRFSRDKLEAIEVSAPSELRADVLLGFPTFHYRYADLTEDDFKYYFWQRDTSLQSVPSSNGMVEPIHILDTAAVTQSAELTEKSGDYFLRIIETCKEMDVPLLLVAAPYELTQIEQERYNTIARIAAENGLTFLNFNELYQEAGIDPQTDFRDPGHLNDSGIEKYSRYLAAYAKAHVDLPDRREDSEHIWNQSPADGIEDSCVYALEEQFQGEGFNYTDTGVTLCDNPYGSYTLLTQIDTCCESEDRVFLSCFSEEPGHYRGLLIRKESDGRLYVILNTASRVELKEFGDTLTLGIIKDRLHYQVYADGSLLGQFTLDPFDPYDGPLVIGCELDADGNPMRYSDVRVMDLKVYDTALNASAVSAWKPARLPRPQSKPIPAAGFAPDYALRYAFEGDGIDAYVDTGVALYGEADQSWTLLARFREGETSGGGVYFSCFAEEEGNYRGLLVRRAGAGELDVVYGNRNLEIALKPGADTTLAIVKERLDYTVYVNGEKLISGERAPVSAYPGSLLIGAQETLGGEKMRFSGVTVYNLEVYNGVMPQEEIVSWSPEHRPAAPKDAGSPVKYALENPFVGDGKGAYLNTGVRLYDVADKNWTLTLTFERGEGHSGMLASCFAEDPNAYRGLLVNLLGEEALTLTLGDTARTMALSPEPIQTLQIAKEGYTYTVTLNGETVVGPTESRVRAHDGALYIGCQAQTDGVPFGFAKVNVLGLDVTGGDLMTAGDEAKT